MSDQPQKLWSVTTLLKYGVPKEALVGWAAKTVAEYAVDNLDAIAQVAAGDRNAAVKLCADARWRRTDQASARGTDVHAIIEQIALGGDPDIPPEIEGYVKQFRRFLDEHQPTYELAEATVYNLEYEYAGTLDAVVNIRGRRFVLDVKTTDRPPSARNRPPYKEVALQLVAYARAEIVGLGEPDKHTGASSRFYVYDPTTQSEPMPQVDGAFALAISPYDYRLIPARVDETSWRKFLAARETALWMLDPSQEMLGRPVRNPAPQRRAA